MGANGGGAALAARTNIQAVRPGMKVFEVSAKTGQNMAQWIDHLTARRSSALEEQFR